MLRLATLTLFALLLAGLPALASPAAAPAATPAPAAAVPPPAAPSAADLKADKDVVPTKTPAADPAPLAAPATPVAPRKRLTWAGGPGGAALDVPPMCINYLILGKTVLPLLDVRSCENGKDIKITKTYENKDWYATDYRYLKSPPAEGDQTIMYRIVGDIDEGTVIEIMNTSGASAGRYSAGLIVRMDGPNLLLVKHLGGGDRCNHGFAKATIDENKILTYGFYVTAADLVPLAFGNNRDLIPANHLEASAASCFGIAYYLNADIDSIELLPAAFSKDRKGWTEYFFKQSCMNELLRDSVRKRTVYLPAQFKILMQHFMRICKDEHIKARRALEKGEKIKNSGG